MFKNYFKIAWRNLVKNKFYSAINIAGLAIGLSVGILILIWVQDEFSYDSFHKNAAAIYKINSHLGKGADQQVWEGSPAPLAIYCRQSIPEVVNTVRIDNVNGPLLFKYADKKFNESNMACVDSTFFTMFDFKLARGNKQRPFPNLNSIIITTTEAKKYFGDIDHAIGKVLSNEYGNFTVSGVMEDFPENSSLHFNMLFPWTFDAYFFEKSGGNGDWKTMDEDLGSFAYQIYVQLQKGASAETVAKKLTAIFRNKKGSDAKNDFFAMQPLQSRHLVAADGSNGAEQIVKIFLLTAVLILLIACINYVNLSTARSILRSKEVSMRKIIGAARYQLFIQFIIESVVLFLLASGLSLLIIYLLIPMYNELSGKHLVLDFSNSNIWLTISIAITGTLILAGIYPALLLSSFKPLQALKGKLTIGVGNASFRKVLVVNQFVFSVGLITATMVISRQLKYIRDKDLGYNREYVFTVSLKDAIHEHYDAVRTELLKQPGIMSVSAANNTVIGTHSSTGDTYWEGKEQGRTFLIQPNGIDQYFIPLLKMKMARGSNFTGAKSDSTHFILNETAVKEAGIKDPVGKSFTLWQTRGTIIGVVKDFNYASLRDPIKPAIFSYNPAGYTMYIKTTGRDAQKAIAAVQKIWNQYTSDIPFDYSFLDDAYNKMYKAEERTGILFNVFAVIAILISCLGLFGLATYTAQVKTKEIGIRKILGASIPGIAGLFAKEFIILVLLAFIIATPITWFAMYKWLQNYTYRVNLSWWTFLMTGVIAIAIAILAVSMQAIKAAVANPVRSLRSE